MEAMYHFRPVRNEEELMRCLAVRHQIFALEKGWIPVNPLGVDLNAWDRFSDHFIAVNQRGQVVGAVRMVHDSVQRFPCETDTPLPADLDRKRLVEVSRLAVLESERRQQSLLMLGLCRQMVSAAAQSGQTHWCAMMRGALIRLLQGAGVCFSYQGEPCFNCGAMRIPVVCEVAAAHEALFHPRLNVLFAPHLEGAYLPGRTRFFHGSGISTPLELASVTGGNATIGGNLFVEGSISSGP